jgi:hypothetical protein
MGKRRVSYVQLLRFYPDSEKINAVSEGAEVLYLRLIAASDDCGRYSGESRWILAKLFTARMITGEVMAEKIEGRLVELENVGLIRRYEVDGKRYLELLNLFRMNRSDVKPVLVFPAPESTSEQPRIDSETEPETDTLQNRNESDTDAGRERDGCGPLEPEPEPEQHRTRTAHGSDSRKKRNRKSGPLAGITESEMRDAGALLKRHRYIANVAPQFGFTRTFASELTFVGMAISALDFVAKQGTGDPVAVFVGNITAGRLFVGEHDEAARRMLNDHRKASNGKPAEFVTAGADRLKSEPPPDPEDFE